MLDTTFNQKKESNADAKDTKKKGLQTKNPLKEMRNERKQVETCSNKNSTKDSTTDKHSMSTRKCKEESKKRQGEREITQTVPTKQAARKGNFTFMENFQDPIKTIESYKNKIST
jgi:hypothetical protein